LDSALRLFSDRGYARTSVRDIARLVGITDAAIYYHFSSKRDLLHALFAERAFLGALAALEDIEPGPDPAEQLQAVSLQILDVLAQNRDIIKVLLVEALADSDAGEAVEEWRAAINRWRAAVERILQIYSHRGLVESKDLDVAAEALVCSVLGAYLDALLSGSSEIIDGRPSETLQKRIARSVRNAA
jgi:AcrR family transcriptional regulator